jgi:hypothetical protein
MSNIEAKFYDTNAYTRDATPMAVLTHSVNIVHIPPLSLQDQIGPGTPLCNTHISSNAEGTPTLFIVKGQPWNLYNPSTDLQRNSGTKKKKKPH